MHYEDLSEYCYYLKSPLDNVFNVGWLVDGKLYGKGDCNVDFIRKLSCIIVGNKMVDVHVNRIRSMHPCTLSDCGSVFIEINGNKEALGVSEIWIPSKDRTHYFASPSLIYHYVKEHGYLPPKPFIEAVMSFDLSKNYHAEDVYLSVIQGHF